MLLSVRQVVVVPTVTTAVGHPGDRLLVCCDGLFEQMTNKNVAGLNGALSYAHRFVRSGSF